MAAVVVGKGAIYIKAIPFQANSYDCGSVCLHGKHILDSIATICNSNDYNILQWNLY